MKTVIKVWWSLYLAQLCVTVDFSNTKFGDCLKNLHTNFQPFFQDQKQDGQKRSTNENVDCIVISDSDQVI